MSEARPESTEHAAAPTSARARAIDFVRRHPDAWIAAGVWLASVLVLTATATHGYVRDEGFYFRAAREYQGFFDELGRALARGRPWEALSDASLRHHFGYNTEHPGLVKLWMGFTWRVFHEWAGWLSLGTSMRLGSITLVAFGNVATYALGKWLWSRRVGLLGVAMLMSAPHVVFHSQLACFDGPMMAATVLTAYAFLRAQSSRRWVWLAGLAFGVALATKHNAVFLAASLGLAWMMVAMGRRARGEPEWWRGYPALVAMGLLGPLVLLATYPYGWHAPLARLGAYYGYHLRHEHYPVDYFGTLYFEPPFPWGFAFGMTLFTVPVVTLVLGAGGLSRVLRGLFVKEGALAPLSLWVLVLCTLVPPLVISFPTVPIFGGTKHWMTMMPFVALLAAWVLDEAFTGLRAQGRSAWAWALVGAVLLSTASETVRTHPYGHTYYNELAGGHPGGAALGMARTFWGGDARPLLDTLNRLAQPGARVFAHHMNGYDFAAYQEDGLLRRDLRWVGDPAQADFGFAYHMREYQDAEYQQWNLLGHRRPVDAVVFDGVGIVSLYDLRAGAQPSGNGLR